MTFSDIITVFVIIRYFHTHAREHQEMRNFHSSSTDDDCHRVLFMRLKNLFKILMGKSFLFPRGERLVFKNKIICGLYSLKSHIKFIKLNSFICEVFF